MKKDFNLPLINAHCHGAMIAFRGQAEDLPLQEWLDYIWSREEEEVNPEMVKSQTTKAIKEMKENKIAAFVDMYFFEDEVAKAAIKQEMPVVIGEGIVSSPTLRENFKEELEATQKLLEKYNNHPLVKPSVAPHAIYTVLPEHLIKAKRLADQYDAIFQIHCSENQKEFEDCRSKHAMTPVQYLNDLGVLDERTLLAHCVWLTDKDIKVLAETGAHVVHCPLSNAKLGSGIAPVPELLEANVNVCLGTDGAASSNRLDIWEAGKFAALLQKANNLDATVLPTDQVVKMMTINGMKALGYERLKGKTIKEWEKEIEQNDYFYLYHLATCDFN